MVQCIDGALTKQNYLDGIRKAGFKHVETLRKTYQEEQEDESTRDPASNISNFIKSY
jgi:arsenite methyltransferase